MSSTTLTDQNPMFKQVLIATREQWQKIYDAIPARDDSGVCGEIDCAINGHDFEEEVSVDILLEKELPVVIQASVVTKIPLRYGAVSRLECDCGKKGCCLL